MIRHFGKHLILLFQGALFTNIVQITQLRPCNKIIYIAEKSQAFNEAYGHL